MSTPTPSLPDGWTLSDDGTTATAPDGSTATGDVLTYVSGAVDQLASLTAQVAQLQAEIAALQGSGDLTALTARVTALETQAADFASSLTSMQIQTEANTDAIIALQSQLAGEAATVIGDIETDLSASSAPTTVPPAS